VSATDTHHALLGMAEDSFSHRGAAGTGRISSLSPKLVPNGVNFSIFLRMLSVWT
jgi:hypothetical protein